MRNTKDSERKLLGGIELDYGDKEKDYLPSYSRYELPTIVVNGAIPKGATAGLDQAEQALRWKEPFLIATFQQKTEHDSKFPSRSWVNNAPTNLYSSSGIDEHADYAHQQYEFKWEPMTDWPPDSPTIEISNERNRGYGGSGVYAQTGTELAVFDSIPRGPALSLGQLSHAPLNAGGQLPLTAHVVANSFASPLIDAGKTTTSSGDRTYLDHSYLVNNALFDGWFFSSAADQPAVAGSPAVNSKQLIENFFKNGERLPNSRLLPYLGGHTAEEVIDRLQSAGDDDYKSIAGNLLVEAPFNVNSTSVAAWEAVLGSNFGKSVPLVDGGVDKDDRLPVARNVPSARGSIEANGDNVTKWSGYRRLTDEQIEKLANEVVAEVKKRGPFQSLAEFVNRQPGKG
ncbi:MAG: hypothetical protein JWO82_466, partial [Akkermansiaceae bacterium]|nr:hypothetical protein [Akkermansiaceae bacterium]